jgi:hypothetical protein
MTRLATHQEELMLSLPTVIVGAYIHSVPTEVDELDGFEVVELPSNNEGPLPAIENENGTATVNSEVMDRRSILEAIRILQVLDPRGELTYDSFQQGDLRAAVLMDAFSFRVLLQEETTSRSAIFGDQRQRRIRHMPLSSSHHHGHQGSVDDHYYLNMFHREEDVRRLYQRILDLRFELQHTLPSQSVLSDALDRLLSSNPDMFATHTAPIFVDYPQR